jgi:KEOPS complex subunit Pcc1
MAHDAVFTFDYATPETARRVQRSIDIEAGDIEGDRTTATVERSEQTVRVSIAAEDLIALRAGINTWASLVEVAERCSGVAQ